MPDTKKKPAMEFIVGALKKNKNLSYAEVRDAAEKKSLTIYPVMYGRAKAMLGLVKAKPQKSRGAPKGKSTAVRSPKKTAKVGRWTNATYADIVEQHPELDSKPESVAVATWALKQDPNLGPDGFRALSEKTGVGVRGRAIGSARELLGLRTNARSAASQPAKRRAMKPKTSASGLDSLSGFVAGIRQTERERDRAVATLRKIRELIETV